MDSDQAGAQAGAQGLMLGSGIGTASIQKLNGSNFLPWKRQIEIIFTLKGLEKALSQDEVDRKLDMQAILILLGTMDDAHKIQVQAEPSAKAIMKNLELQHANTSISNKHKLISNFFKYVKPAGESLNLHIGRMKEMRATIVNLGESISEDLFQIALIHSFPEFPDVLRQWEVTHPSMKTTEFLVATLNQRESDTKEAHQAFAVRRPAYPYLSVADRKKNTFCAICRKKGHWARECPENKQGATAALINFEQHEESDESECDIALNTESIDPSLKNKWVADTGATSHMCNNKYSFMTLTLFEKTRECMVGDGNRVTILGKGNVKVKCFVETGTVVAILYDVLYIPDLATNLLSIGSCTTKGLTAMFEQGICFLKRRDKTVAMGKRINKELYLMNLQVLKKAQETALITKTSRTMSEWHRVLGHPGQKRIEILAKQPGMNIKIKESPERIENCVECAKAKGKRVPHPEKLRREEITGARVHVDLSGKLIKGLSNEYYFLLCKDEATEFCFVYCIPDKSVVWKYIDKMITSFEVESGKQIQVIQSDQGTEFVNKNLEYILTRKPHIL